VQFIYIICQCEKIFFFIMVVFVFLHSPICLQGRNHVFKVVGVQFLGLGYYYPSTEKNRQVYPVWCSRLHNHTLFIKKLCKKVGRPSQFWGGLDPRSPQWLRPWLPVAFWHLWSSPNFFFIWGYIFPDNSQLCPLLAPDCTALPVSSDRLLVLIYRMICLTFVDISFLVLISYVTWFAGLQVVQASWAEVVWWAESVVTSHSRVKTMSVTVTASTSRRPAHAVSKRITTVTFWTGSLPFELSHRHMPETLL